MVYPLNFWLICVSTLLFMLGFNLLIPELNAYITKLGGADYKGLVITLFTITAGISRPFSGKLSDIIGRKPVVIIGGTVSLIVSLMYPWALSVFGFLLLRFLHGFCTGFQPTGATAMVADIIPEHRRGEAMGIFGVTISMGMGMGQALGSPIANAISIEGLFYVSAGFSLVSISILPQLNETLAGPQKFKLSMLRLKKDEFFENSVWPAFIIMFLSMICSGIIFIVIFDYSDWLGLENKGLFMGIYLSSTIFMRLIAGRSSDRYGREPVLFIGLIMLAFAMLIIGTSETVFHFFLGAVIFGGAAGINSPTLFAWTTDLAPKESKGKGLGSLFVALEFGIGSGALLTIYLYDNQPENFFRTFLFAAFIALLSSLFLIIYLRRQKLSRDK